MLVECATLARPTPPTEELRRYYRIYGHTFAANSPIFHLPPAPPSDSVDVSIDTRSGGATHGPAPGRSVLRSPTEPDDCVPTVEAFRTRTAIVIRHRGVAEHEVLNSGRRVRTTLLTGADPADAEAVLLTHVLTVALALQGVILLHASAVAIERPSGGAEGIAIAFAADTGGGKTALAAAATAAGHRIIADDIAPLRVVGDTVAAGFGIPVLRMGPELAAHFLGDQRTGTVRTGAAQKCVIPTDALGHGCYAEAWFPLRSLFVLRRRPASRPAGEPTVKLFSPHRATVELARNCYVAPALRAFGLERQHVKALAAVAERVPVAALSYDSGYDRLEEAVAAAAAFTR